MPKVKKTVNSVLTVPPGFRYSCAHFCREVAEPGLMHMTRNHACRKVPGVRIPPSPPFFFLLCFSATSSGTGTAPCSTTRRRASTPSTRCSPHEDCPRSTCLIIAPSSVPGYRLLPHDRLSGRTRKLGRRGARVPRPLSFRRLHPPARPRHAGHSTVSATRASASRSSPPPSRAS